MADVSSFPTASRPEQAEAIIIVKASPQLGDKHGETVCTAGITRTGEWVRLFPIQFRTLEQAQQYARWDVVDYRWRAPKNDRRSESRRVEHDTLQVTGKLAVKDRFGLVDPMVKSSLNDERAAGRSFAFIRPSVRKFVIEPLEANLLAEEQRRFDAYAGQGNLFMKALHPYRACPYKFSYEYEFADGRRTGRCQDWETEATFFRWRQDYGEADALRRMQHRWGKELPAKGLLFAMGTHSIYPDTWLINGLVQMSEFGQLSLGL